MQRLLRGLVLPIVALAAPALSPALSMAQAESVRLVIKPSVTDPTIIAADNPHIIIYDRAGAGKLLLWLPGTGGVPERGPFQLFDTAIAQGYRVIDLSYVDTPAVDQICTAGNTDPECAAKFRQKRIYGDNVTSVINDKPADAIVNRFVKLLQYLARSDQAGNWTQYLENAAPRWDRIAVAGLSQGGGMAAFIAKRQSVGQVIIFSGGWDTAGSGRMAGWYAAASATPPDRWYGTYHVQEQHANALAQIYQALGIPAANIFAFDQPVRGDPHNEGNFNPVYRPQWIRIFSRARG